MIINEDIFALSRNHYHAIAAEFSDLQKLILRKETLQVSSDEVKTNARIKHMRAEPTPVENAHLLVVPAANTISSPPPRYQSVEPMKSPDGESSVC